MSRLIQDTKISLNFTQPDELMEAKRLFNWALSYEKKGLQIAAEALRDEGRKSYRRYLEQIAFTY